jgi:hypothetical protein
MGVFTDIINRIATVRDFMVDAILDQEGKADYSMSFAELSTAVYGLAVGMNHVRNGYQLFSENDTMVNFPSHLNVAYFDSMYQMCYKCTALRYVPQLNTANVTNMMWAFYGCSALERIDGLITDNITSANELFHGCSSLHTIGSPLDFSNVTSKIENTFTTCKSLVNVSFKGSINVNITISGCSKLSVDSLVSLFNALADNVSDKICKIGSTNLGKLTDDQKAIATNKGWTLQ